MSPSEGPEGTAAQRRPRAPKNVAHYNLLERVGEGALGPVFRARDTRTGRTVAVKLVPAAALSDPDVRQDFFADAAAAAKLSHPGIATLFDVAEHDGGAYLAYEFVPGVTLRDEMSGQPLAPRRALDIAIQIADALAEGHASDIVHGDVRPGNIVITPKGTAKLLEFGMARWTGAGALRVRAVDAHSLGHESLGVVAYLSPEQALGGAVDARSDLFSLATVLYETLTGRNPFTAATAAQTALNVIQATAAAPSSINRSLPPGVDAVLGRALSKDIDARPDGAAFLAAQLRKIADTMEARSKDAMPPAEMAIDDEGGGAGKWIAIVIAVAVIAILWSLLR